MNIKGKKILIFGGSSLSADIVLAAKAMGVYTIVTDWNDVSDSVAKQVADEYWDVSITDYDELTRRIKLHNVAGVITGFSDSYLLPYQHLCEINGLPCYATKEQFELTLNKASFKEFCRKHDVQVVPEYDLHSFNPQLINTTSAILIKPVDNSGSRGICKCEKPEDFSEKLDYALGFSQKKQVVIEKYMDCDDVSFEYKIQNGEVVLSSICDREVYKTMELGSVTSKLVYPSKYAQQYLSTTNSKVIKMFKSMGLQNGVLFMQAFVEDGHFYFYEMGYRLSGGRHFIFTENQNNSNAAKELVHFSLTGEMADYDIISLNQPIFKQTCTQLSILCKGEEIVKGIEGWSMISQIKEVVDATCYYGKNARTGGGGTTSQIFARIHVVTNNKMQYNQIEAKIYSLLHVYNEKQQDIIIRNTSM